LPHGTNSVLRRDHLPLIKPWGQRAGRANGSLALAASVKQVASGVKEANVLALNPPPVPGIGAAGAAASIYPRDSRGGAYPENSPASSQDLLGQANSRPRLTRVSRNLTAKSPDRV